MEMLRTHTGTLGLKAVTSRSGGLRGWNHSLLLLFLTNVCPVHISLDRQRICWIYDLLQPVIPSYCARFEGCRRWVRGWMEGENKQSREGGDETPQERKQKKSYSICQDQFESERDKS
jgi:hypothetical protein